MFRWITSDNERRPEDEESRVVIRVAALQRKAPVPVGLTPQGITIDCGRGRLREVRICFTRDLKFRDCSPSVQRACRSERVIMPPVRGERLNDLPAQPSAIAERILNVDTPSDLALR